MKKKSLKTFVLFCLILFIWSFFFGGVKFLLKNISAEHIEMEPKIILEKVAGFLSFGAMIAYVIGGSLNNVFTKRKIVLWTTALALITLIFYFFGGREPFLYLAITALLIGLFYGIFAVTKSVIVSIEIIKTKLPDTMVNGITVVVFIVSMILGAFTSTILFEKINDSVLWIFCGILGIVFFVATFLNYEKYETKTSFNTSIKEFFKEALWLLKNKYMVLFPAAFLWAIATIISLKSIPYSEKQFGIAESTSSLILLFSSVGVIIGNILTLKVKNRWLWFRIYTYLFALMIFLFPVFTKTFTCMKVYSVFVGIFMGGATNLIDSYFLQYIGKVDKKENGAALQGFLINGILAGLLFFIQFIPDEKIFLSLALMTFFLGLFVRFTLKLIK